MGVIRRMSSTLLCSAGFASAAVAQSFDGRYLGNVFHSEVAGVGSDRTSHLYDIIMRQDTPNALRFDLGASLRYDSRFSYETDLLRSRTFGELSSRSWRVYGQFVPWQRTQPTSDIPSRRDLQLGISLMPPRAPQLAVTYTRADRRTRPGESGVEDARADVSYSTGPIAARAGVRRLESHSAGFEAPTRTHEVRAGLNGSSAWKRIAFGGDYDAVLTRIAARDRRIDQDIQRASGDATWSPHRQASFGVNGLVRWGTTHDNAVLHDIPIDETSLGARVTYLPFRSVMLNASRSYYKTTVFTGSQISDYMRLEALYQHELVARTMLHTGYSQTLDLGSTGGSIPNSSAHLTVDGTLRQNFWLRAETRASHTPHTESALQWYFGLDLRTRPNPSTTFDVLWNRYSLPELAGVQQIERTWEIKLGYQPRSGASLIGSFRRLDGEGRLQRAESIWSANGTWRLRESATLGVYGSTRESALPSGTAHEDILGIDLTLQPRELLQLRGTTKITRRTAQPRDTSTGVILTRNF